MSTWKGEEVDK